MLQRDETFVHEKNEASLQEQRRELRALLLQDLANFRQGHGYLMAKELEEKVAALRLSKSVLHRVKILHYLRLRERHSGSLHPALLAANPDTLPPRRLARLQRPRARAGMLPVNSPHERRLPPIPEEDSMEEMQSLEHPAQRHQLGNIASKVGKLLQDAKPPEAPPAEAVGHGSEAPDAHLDRASSHSTGHERPSLKRRFLKKNEKALPQGFSAPTDGAVEGSLRVNSISHQYLASDSSEAAEPHASSLSKMVLKIEINCMNPWADAAQPTPGSTAAPGSPSAPAGGRHTTVTDIVLDAASPLVSACPGPATPHDSSHPTPVCPKKASVLASSPPLSPLASPGPSGGPGQPLSPEAVCQEQPLYASSSRVSLPNFIQEPTGDAHESPPRPLSSGPTDYLSWAAEVTREEASRLGSPGTPA